MVGNDNKCVYLNDCFGFVIIDFNEINDHDRIYKIGIKWNLNNNWYKNNNVLDYDVKSLIINYYINE